MRNQPDFASRGKVEFVSIDSEMLRVLIESMIYNYAVEIGSPVLGSGIYVTTNTILNNNVVFDQTEIVVFKTE